MKNKTWIYGVLTAVALTIGILGTTGCGNSEPKPAAAETAAAKYTCPMHSEVVQDAPGKCPKCQMDLVVKK